MSAAVRLGDMSTGHCYNPRANVQGSPNVFINGIASHRVGDFWPSHNCNDNSHSGVMASGSPNVFVNGLAMARVGDSISCGDTAAAGSPNVFCNG